jgi:hypothetical protein
MADLEHRLARVDGKVGSGAGRMVSFRLQEAGNRGFTPGEAGPAAMVEGAFFSRILALLAVIPLLVFAGACGLEAVRRGKVVKAMARRLGGLFTWRDHLWLGGLGLLAPLVYGLLVVGMPSFMDEWQSLGWLVQCGLWCVLMMVLPVIVAHWRWHKAAGFLGVTPAAWWLGIIPAVLLLPAIPGVRWFAVKMAHLSEDERMATILGLSSAGMIGLLWLLWVAVMNLFTGRHGALGPNVVCRSLLPWSLVALFAVLGIAGGLRLSEKSWHQRDPLLRTLESGHFLNPLEERTCRAISEAWNE